MNDSPTTMNEQLKHLLLGLEVNNVLKALRKNDLDVVAIHQHMFGTKPNIIFLHYWGKGEATKLASGFRAALQELGKQGGSQH